VEVVLFTSSPSNSADNPLRLPTCRKIRVGRGREVDGLGSRRGRITTGQFSSSWLVWCGVGLESPDPISGHVPRGAFGLGPAPSVVAGLGWLLWTPDRTRGRVGGSKSIVTWYHSACSVL
jgi:hypothetical protein